MKLHNTTDRIEKEIVLHAPRSRVWRALADAEEFGAWFGMKLEGTFAPGGRARGQVALPGRLSSEGPLSITRLTAGTAVTRQAITKHLGVLATAGLVSDRRRGRERIWELEPEQMQAARAYLEHVSKRWDEALGRLKKFV